MGTDEDALTRGTLPLEAREETGFLEIQTPFTREGVREYSAPTNRRRKRRRAKAQRRARKNAEAATRITNLMHRLTEGT